MTKRAKTSVFLGRHIRLASSDSERKKSKMTKANIVRKFDKDASRCGGDEVIHTESSIASRYSDTAEQETISRRAKAKKDGSPTLLLVERRLLLDQVEV